VGISCVRYPSNATGSIGGNDLVKTAMIVHDTRTTSTEPFGTIGRCLRRERTARYKFKAISTPQRANPPGFQERASMFQLRQMARIGFFLIGLTLALPAAAEPTRVVVRAMAKDAKFIGDGMGGVRITLTNARNGQKLAQGIITGGTGDTKRLSVEPRVRGQALSTPDAARFEAILDIDQPTLVRAEARGPLGKPGAAITVSSMMWLLPGQAVDGDGWLLEFPGLVVEPAWETSPSGLLQVSAKVTMMCGCPIDPGGHWDAAQYEIKAALLDGSGLVAETPLSPDGKPSHFSGALAAQKAGRYRLLFTAHNAATGNTGVAELPIVYRRPKPSNGEHLP
jgi:hypothetical protein